MSVSVNHFESLKQRFPVWEDLKAHMESVEGGGLRVVDGAPAIVRYNKKPTSTVEDLYSGLFRSVVWDTVANTPLCVAPPKGREGLPPLGVQLSATEDFVDGFMMNAWVGGDGVLKLATRTRVGADNKFYSEKSFAELFAECLATTPLKTADALQTTLNTLREEQKATSAFVSFVVQHPEHRIVAKIVTPSVNVVHTGYVTETGAVQISERATNWPQALARLQIPSYPLRNFHSEQEVEDLLRRTAVQRGWRWQGLVFKDGAGGRWRMRTPTYTMLRELRGSEATAMERFFRLRQQKRVSDYLKHYSEERQTFWGFEEILRARTADCMLAYNDVHKGHTCKFKELPEAYRPVVYLLHVKWLQELREKGYSVRLQNAIDAVNGLRDFEKKRLMDAGSYVVVAAAEPSVAAVAASAPADAAPTA